MPTVAFVSPKGGAGKTTAALLLALGLAAQGRRVAMIDSDPNKPLMHWAGLAGRPERLTAHAAPTAEDVRDALREAKRREPEWIILDTEGSIRGALAFTTLKLDLVITPLAASQLEAIQAVKAAEMVREFGRRAGNPRHRALLTRIPVTAGPEALRPVIEQLRGSGLPLLPTALVESDAFRALFSAGGDLGPEASPARLNAQAYVAAVLDLLGVPLAAQ